jgi:hypothetical protein
MTKLEELKAAADAKRDAADAAADAAREDAWAASDAWIAYEAELKKETNK